MHEKYMKEALKEANKALLIDEVPIGCVIVKNDKIIARAHNLRETKQQSINHAEILAIQKACKKIDS
ncbi:MAG: deaminase, partial [Erysipelotrichaceae bacterium]